MTNFEPSDAGEFCQDEPAIETLKFNENDIGTDWFGFSKLEDGMSD